jgi:hypothetical protein
LCAAEPSTAAVGTSVKAAPLPPPQASSVASFPATPQAARPPIAGAFRCLFVLRALPSQVNKERRADGQTEKISPFSYFLHRISRFFSSFRHNEVCPPCAAPHHVHGGHGGHGGSRAASVAAQRVADAAEHIGQHAPEQPVPVPDGFDEGDHSCELILFELVVFY